MKRPLIIEKHALLAQAQQGDMNAFAELFEPLRGKLYAVAYRMVGPDDAEDIVMDTFLQAWKSLPKFNRQSSLKTWLFRIARNKAIDFYRKHQKNPVTPDDDLENKSIADNIQDGPDQEVISHDIQNIVRKALQALPKIHKKILLMRYVDDLSYSEIAAATSLSMGTVMSRLYNAKKKTE